MANSQLAKVTAPNITEVDFAAKLQESFETINENFKKIASLPFLQGAQGDSFRTIQYLIFDEHGNITQKGALLLNSIGIVMMNISPMTLSGKTFLLIL